MHSSYRAEDVTILLKNLTGALPALDTAERERRIQSGVHYSEMLPLEYRPTAQYLALYQEALRVHCPQTARAVAVLAQKIWRRKGQGVVLVSLARAGTPIGILLKWYIRQVYGWDAPHYSISIIRGRGIDHNAMHHILAHHAVESLLFVDGWIGKGAILGELQNQALAYPGLDPTLAVLADPARLTALHGTQEDFLIPSACLNATVSGLFSRTICNAALLGPADFHGAVYFEELEPYDRSYEFLQRVAAAFPARPPSLPVEREAPGSTDMENIQRNFGIENIHFIKPGIGETTRVLLRRLPWKVLVRDLSDTRHIGHILRLCQEKQVELLEYPLQDYRACGLIQNLHADA